MQDRINAVQDHLDNGRFKQAESDLKEIMRNQEKLVDDKVWSKSRGDIEMSITHSMMAKVMCLVSDYELAINHSKAAWGLLATIFGTEHRITISEKECLDEYKQQNKCMEKSEKKPGKTGK